MMFSQSLSVIVISVIFIKVYINEVVLLLVIKMQTEIIDESSNLN